LKIRAYNELQHLKNQHSLSLNHRQK
jgi:hypothetical protein